MAKKKKQTTVKPQGATKPVKKKKGSLKDLQLPGWVGIIAAVLIFAVIIFLRINHLSADPPTDIFWSQDVWTDPPQYTSYARNAEIFDDWNPLDDPRLVMFMKNSTGVVARVVFAVFGVGYWQSNLVGVIFSFGAIFFFSLAIGRWKGRLAGLLTAFFLGTNYIFLSYGRLPFLENPMNFWLALGVYLLTRGIPRDGPVTKGLKGRDGWLLATGISVGVAAFFGKMIALHALPVFLVVATLAAWQRDDTKVRKAWLKPGGYVLAGFAAVAIFWLLYAYLPAGAEVRRYLSEQSTGLYGSPEGLTSVSGFFNRVFSFGSDTALFPRLPLLAVFGFIGAAVAFLPLARIGKFSEKLKRIRPDYLLVGLWFWIAYLALMPWNYRPLRYETVLLLPLAGAAALILTDLVRRGRSSSDHEGKYSTLWSLILGVVLFAIPVYQLLAGLGLSARQGSANSIAAIVGIGAGLAGGFLFPGIWRNISSWWRKINRSTRLAEVLVILVVIGAGIFQSRMIVGWWDHTRHSIVEASEDLGEILGPGAVLVGSYATGLCLANELKNIVYMFGVANVDHTLFYKYPITHLAVVDDNKKGRAFTDYPDVAGRSRRVTSYNIGNRPVGIFRITENTPNSTAKKYEPTDYEKAMRSLDFGDEDSMKTYIARFAAKYPDNYNVARLRGLYYMRDSTFDSASLYFEKAIEQYPSDYTTLRRLIHCEMTLYEQNKDGLYLRKAQEHAGELLRLVPNDPTIRAQLAPIIGR